MAACRSLQRQRLHLEPRDRRKLDSAAFAHLALTRGTALQSLVKTFEVTEVPVRCVKFIARKNWYVASQSLSKMTGSSLSLFRFSGLYAAQTTFMSECTTTTPLNGSRPLKLTRTTSGRLSLSNVAWPRSSGFNQDASLFIQRRILFLLAVTTWPSSFGTGRRTGDAFRYPSSVLNSRVSY